MNINEARKRVKEIKDAAGDPEKAHILEDKLFLDFVTLVSKTGSESPLKEIARAVLKSTKINFPRHSG